MNINYTFEGEMENEIIINPKPLKMGYNSEVHGGRCFFGMDKFDLIRLEGEEI